MNGLTCGSTSEVTLSRRAGGRIGLWLAGYVALMAAVAWSMLAARNWALTELSSDASVQQWEEWRDDVRQQSDTSPVRRRVPASAEPPTLVLMRDHFAVVFVGAILFTTVLYGVTAWLVRGMIATPPAKSGAVPLRGHRASPGEGVRR